MSESRNGLDEFKISCKTWTTICNEIRTDLQKTPFTKVRSQFQTIQIIWRASQDGIKESERGKVSEAKEKARELFSENDSWKTPERENIQNPPKQRQMLRVRLISHYIAISHL